MLAGKINLMIDFTIWHVRSINVSSNNNNKYNYKIRFDEIVKLY